MGVYDLIRERRTIRKFKQVEISNELLLKYVDCARLAPSGANLQSMRYMIVNGKPDTDRLFEQVAWAAYIAPEGNPAENERPVAYIILLNDTEIRKSGYELDAGAAAQNIFLAAQEDGIGTCWMGAINRNEIRELFKIPEKYVINTVIAMGYPMEHPVMEEECGSIKYYKDGNGVLHVPKRKLEDVILKYE